MDLEKNYDVIICVVQKDIWNLENVIKRVLANSGCQRVKVIGTFMEKEFSQKIKFRPLKSRRNIANVIGNHINKYDLKYFTKKYDFVTFEKAHKVQSIKLKQMFNKVKHSMYSAI